VKKIEKNKKKMGEKKKDQKKVAKQNSKFFLLALMQHIRGTNYLNL